MTKCYNAIVLAFMWVACVSPEGNKQQSDLTHLSDDSLLTLVQYKTFQYFWDGAEPTSGAARERYHIDGIYPENDKHIITTGGTGFGVMAILVGIERNFYFATGRRRAAHKTRQLACGCRSVSWRLATLDKWGDGQSEAIQSKR
jgi:hypothetical protein